MVTPYIYNRFFRTAIIYPLKKYFSDYDIIEVDNVYHDTGNMKHHKYFKYQLFALMIVSSPCSQCSRSFGIITRFDTYSRKHSVRKFKLFGLFKL